jgi:hypothetical protein
VCGAGDGPSCGSRAGGTVIACGRYKAKNKATGRELDAQFAHFWGIRAGKLVTFQQYADTYQAMAAVTGSHSGPV